HSSGLEAAAQAGEIQGAEDVARFARDAIWQAGWGALPLVRGAFEDPSSLPRLDERAEAFLANHVANRASRTQGRAFLSTAARVELRPDALAQPAPLADLLQGTHDRLYSRLFQS